LALAPPAAADPLPDGFEAHRFNASFDPVTADGVTTFHIEPGDCSDIDYGDGRGESDCKNGNSKSIMRYTRDMKIGDSVEYRFDLQLDPAFAYPGEYHPEALRFRPAGWDSSLRIASWEGPFIKDFVFMLKADTTRGVTFFGRECQAPDKLGEWLGFSLKVHWANNNRGWAVATCDERVVYISEGVPSTRQIQCYLANECQPGTVREPKSLNFILGLAFNGFGVEHKKFGLPSQFRAFQADGITMRMRNISVSRDAVLYDEAARTQVAALQARLNDLGCDVGSADGAVGPRTREMALICRDFGDEMPGELNVATLPVFVALYARPDAASLPPGRLPAPPAETLHIAPLKRIETGGTDVVYEFAGLVERRDADDLDLSYLLIGRFDAAQDQLSGFEILLTRDIGSPPSALAACRGQRVERWGDGSSHVVLRYGRSGDAYARPDPDCITAALPTDAADEARFVIDNFTEMATTIVVQDSAQLITDEDVRRFIGGIAAGDLRVAASS
jgi:hypothetical protein